MSTTKDAKAKSQALLKRTSKSWVSERIVQLFGEVDFETYFEQGLDLISRRRVLDFVVVAGNFSARVYEENSSPLNIKVKLDVFTNEQWNTIFSMLSEQALYMAKLLAGEVPAEIEQAFQKASCEIVPTSPNDFTITIDDELQETLSPQVAAVIYRFCDKLSGDPFLMFTLRGRGQEETLLELRKRRSALKSSSDDAPLRYQQLDYADAPPLTSTMDHFWQAGAALNELLFTIKADELPAAILRWIDPLPLGGVEDDVEPKLAEAYEQVARRAQAFGLGL